MIWVAILIGILLLFSFPKQMGILIGVVAVGCGATYLYSEAEKSKKIKQIEAVIVTVSFNTKYCSEEFPIFVNIKNRSNKIVEKVSWGINAYRKGYSSNVADNNYFREYSSDKILNTGQHFGVCYKVPPLSGTLNPKDLNWLAVNKSIDFKQRQAQ
ncbi:hypothetical protein AKG98_1638 [Moritella sp. JT01]|uniref:hypothetical protein n=1 Tax=Moritella sp. JT01 TaxID=756698 RepID=UPI000796407F|nr:hypothetical protein [Moritella sp. JT01]KXO13893.1 hypothetical protein AKG98_1638 [Moritella sp. JT01]